MKIHEMLERLEELGNDLLIISETAGAVEVSLDSEIFTADKVCWALIGIIRSLEKAAEDVDELVKETMGICKIVDSL